MHEELLRWGLVVRVEGGELEQLAVWTAMSADLPGWSFEMRRAVVAVLDAPLDRLEDALPMLTPRRRG